MGKQGKHFLSYAREDGDRIAEKLYLDLTGGSPSVPVWRDQGEIEGGATFGEVIKKAIRSAHSFLFVMTPKSVSSPWCQSEIQYAKRCGKEIIPLRFFEDVEPPLELEIAHDVSFVDRDRDRWEAGGNWSRQSWEEGIAKLRRQLVRLQEQVPVDLDTVLAPLEEKRDQLQQRWRSETGLRLRQRIRLEIADLTRKIDELQGRGDPDPSGVAMVAAMIEEQRSTAAEDDRGLFINPPPAEVPGYFRGRDPETAILIDFLTDDSQRFLTVTGRGGIGKTALVCHLLQSLQDREPPPGAEDLEIDGIVFLRVTGAHEINVRRLSEDLLRLKPEAAERLQRKLERVGPSARERVEALLGEFPSGRTILLLDNLEDLIDADRVLTHHEIAEALSTIYGHPLRHGLKVILTTRVAPKEPRLVAPPRGRLLDLRSGLRPEDAIAVLRAMDADGLVGLREAPEELLRKAWELTEGNPRALETLVGILAGDVTVTLDEVLEDARRLPGDVLEVLVGEAFQRLDLPTQRVMQALAIYGRPVSAAAVAFVLRPYLPNLDHEQILRRLVNMRFVHRNGRQYYLHRVDQSYVAERTLPAEDDGAERSLDDSRPFTRDALRLLAAEYCREVRKSPEDLRSMSDLEPQLAEIDLRCKAGDFENAAWILLDVDVPYLGRWAQYQTMVELHHRLEGKLEKPSLREANYKNLSLAYAALGNTAKASHYSDLALREAREMADPRRIAENLITRGNQRSSEGKTRRAQAHYQQALSMARELGDRKPEVKCLCNIGNVFLDLGDAGKALEHYEQADAIAQESEFREMTALIRYNAGRALLTMNRPEEALAKAATGLAIGLEFNNWRLSSFCGYLAALVHFFQRDLDAAESSLAQALEMAIPENEYQLLALSGLIALKRRQLPAARHGFAEASRRANAMIEGNPENYLAFYCKGLALAGLMLCENPDYLSPAIQAYKAALEINRESGVAGRALRLLDALRAEDAGGLLQGVRLLLANAVEASAGSSGRPALDSGPPSS